MDHSNLELVNMLSQQTTFMINPLVQTTMDSFKILTNQLARLRETLTLP